MISSKQITSHFYGKYFQHSFQWKFCISKFKVYKDNISCNLPVNEYKRPNRNEIKAENDNEADGIVEVMSHDALR